MENQVKTPRPPLSQIIIYAIGQFGWALASFGAGNLLIYFYMPPESTSEVIFPPYIYQGAILGIMTIIGLVTFGGRVFDAITDPIIAGWSDRNQSKFGKRKMLMGIAAIPFALTSFLIFYPISDVAGGTNTLWLVGILFLYYLFFTMYLVPYTALISELGHDPKDRMLISTIISVAFALALMLGGSVYALKGYFAEGRSATESFQVSLMILTIISLIAMLIPVFFLQENKYCKQSDIYIDTRQSLKSVFANVNFRWFVGAEFLYWISMTFIQLGISYYVITIFDLDQSLASAFMPVCFLTSFLLYVPLNFLVKKFGKKPVLSFAFLVFGSSFLLTVLTDLLQLPSELMFYLIAILSGFPLAAFGIIPNVLVADVTHEHEEKTGQNLAGMFFGTRTLFMKFGISTANLIFPSLLLLGKSADNPLGVQVTAFAAVGFMIAGWLLFRNYKEN